MDVGSFVLSLGVEYGERKIDDVDHYMDLVIVN